MIGSIFDGVMCVYFEGFGLTASGASMGLVQEIQQQCCPASYNEPPSASPTALLQQCPLADNQDCGCEIVNQADYQGMINTPEGGSGAVCLRWDSGTAIQFANRGQFPDRYGENYCQSSGRSSSRPQAYCAAQVPGGDPYWFFCEVPFCDPCSCVPAYGVPNLGPCACPSVHQAEECCVGIHDEASCKCVYLKKACLKSLENGTTEFCALASEVCCAKNENPWCECNVYEQICTENPSKFTCDFAAETCCSNDSVCKCDFFHICNE